MRLKEENNANIKILAGDTTYTLDDKALLAEFWAKALNRQCGLIDRRNGFIDNP